MVKVIAVVTAFLLIATAASANVPSQLQGPAAIADARQASMQPSHVLQRRTKIKPVGGKGQAPLSVPAPNSPAAITQNRMRAIAAEAAGKAVERTKRINQEAHAKRVDPVTTAHRNTMAQLTNAQIGRDSWQGLARAFLLLTRESTSDEGFNADT
ncbi:hypothetical protein BC829DRAFT_479196 [Chytridium lagenaria]|nr:hypothetical protein BC829DRAFT_479196 [Chytridium lagenaria]